MSPYILPSVFSVILSSGLQKSRSRGGDEQIRTVDPLRAKQVLSQLSYTPLSLRGFLLGSVLTILSRSERYLVN